MGRPLHVVNESYDNYARRKNRDSNMAFLAISLMILLLGIVIVIGDLTGQTGWDKALGFPLIICGVIFLIFIKFFPN